MITFFVVLSLFIAVKTSDVEDLQVLKVKHGESVTIKCKIDRTNLVWFKQSLGKLPQLVVRQVEKTSRFSAGFNDGRFKVGDEKLIHLNIEKIKEEDTGTYFCLEDLKTSPQFVSGTLLIVEAEEMRRHSPTVMMMENEDSPTIQCSVQAFTSSCEEQSVFWFRLDSGESHPGIIHAHGDGSDECEKSSEADSPTHSCVYTLPKRKLTTSGSGTFYCAVAACGQILFTNGTTVGGRQINENTNWSVFVLITSNIIFVIVIMVLLGVLLKKQRKAASNNQPNNTNQAGVEDVLNYAAVRFAKKPSSSRTSRDKSYQDVYAQVKIK